MILQERTEKGTNFFCHLWEVQYMSIAFNAKPAKLVSSLSNFNIYECVTVFLQNTFSYL